MRMAVQMHPRVVKRRGLCHDAVMKEVVPDLVLQARQRRLLSVLPDIVDAVKGGEPADRWLARYFRRHANMGASDRRNVGEAVFSYFRWKGWLEDHHEVAAPTLALAQRWDQSFPEAPPPGRAWSDLAPDWFTAHLAVPDGLDASTMALRCLQSFQQRPPTWLRRSLRTPPATWEALAAKGLPIRPWPYLPTIASLAKPVSRQHLYGDAPVPVEIQDLASQAVGLAALPQPGETWWDCCAGGGGKTLHLADLMGAAGTVLATDPRDSALRELVRRAQRHGYESCIRAQVASAEQYRPECAFDGILIDAPCSGIGTWSRNPDARWRTGPAHIRAAAVQQAELLHHVVPFLKPGGKLVYAVCTVTRAETVDQTTAFQQQHPEMQPERLTNPLRSAFQSEPKTGGAHGLWVLPWEGPCGAMFIASWRKGACP